MDAVNHASEHSPPVLYDWMQFPVVWVGERDVGAFIDLEHLRTIENSLLKAGWRRRGCIVDSRLTRRIVNSVRVVGHIPPLWGYRFPGIRMLFLDYDFTGEAARITLEELKTLIIRAERGHGYESMAGSPRGFEGGIRRLNSFDAVVKQYLIGPKRGWTRKFWAGPFD